MTVGHFMYGELSVYFTKAVLKNQTLPATASEMDVPFPCWCELEGLK